MAQMYGANVAELARCAQQLRAEADHLDVSADQLTRQLGSFDWLGSVAVRFTDIWQSRHRVGMRSLADFLRENAAQLERNAQQQRDASSSNGIVSPFGHLPPFVMPDGVELRPFDARGSSRGDFVEHFLGTGDWTRAGKEEIEIRMLENGSYVVVLPGVTDLSENKTDIVDPRDGDWGTDAFHDGENSDTARLTRYADQEMRDTTDTYDNPYAIQVREAMLRYIPPGATVMLVGHSFGAYTAMELAGDSGFADNFNITHVVAAAADTDWKLREIPASTSVLVLNNREDLVFRTEDPVVADYRSDSPNHVEIEFNGQGSGSDFWSRASGHDPKEYARFLTDAGDRQDLARFIDGAGDLYSGPGESFAVKVPDVRDQ